MIITNLRRTGVGSPIVPRNVLDPAAQFGNLRKAKTELTKRYRVINKAMREMILDLNPTRTVVRNDLHVNKVVYEYQIDAERYRTINLFIKQLLERNLLDGGNDVLLDRWWLSANITTAYEDGTADALQSAKNISPVEVVGAQTSQLMRSIDLDQIKFSPGFTRRVGLVNARVFNEMQGLTESSKTDLAESLTRGMTGGKGVRVIAKDIKDRLDVSYSRALRIARTETLNAYRTATAAETDTVNSEVFDDSDYHMQQLWFSALAPTSRPWHVSRHGNVYSTAEVREFYLERGNPINCLCSQSPILVHRKTGDIIQIELVRKLKKQKKAYQLANNLAA